MWKLNCSLWYLGIYCYYFSFSELDNLLYAFNHLSGRRDPLVLFGVAPFSLGQYKSTRVFSSLKHLRKGSLIICPPGHHLYGPLEADNSQTAPLKLGHRECFRDWKPWDPAPSPTGCSIPSRIPVGCWSLLLHDLQTQVSAIWREFLKTVSDCWAGPCLPVHSLEPLPAWSCS